MAPGGKEKLSVSEQPVPRSSWKDKFGDDGAYRKILENGPWHFNGRLMVLQQWYPQMELAKVGLSKVPLWIQIFNIPLEYWNGPGLSYIASAVGKPLYANEVTEANQRLSFAWVCFEVDIDSVLPESFELQFPKGLVLIFLLGIRGNLLVAVSVKFLAIMNVLCLMLCQRLKVKYGWLSKAPRYLLLGVLLQLRRRVGVVNFKGVGGERRNE
ncbi:uncharacterized protein LOC131329517 isoform X2 [Rhododendron vialii]|uniref:uncharacterized protein LOC131329517 isoform X2 n=1 Tax=Rhododendron vialii TaxID=182163 RepID=UPI00265FF826|nr:uncharacterized protein LOC131329517 isoform X2 [Rhododendron vialii]